MGQTVGVRLDVTICTDEQSHSFLKVGFSSDGIDPYGDVEAQAKVAEQASIKILRVLNDGLQEEVANAILTVDNPKLVSEQFEGVNKRIDRTEQVLMVTVAKVKELIGDMPALAGDTPESEVAVDQPIPTFEAKKKKAKKDTATK